MTFELVEDDNLSRAWARAVRPMLGRRAVKEVAPICISIVGFEQGAVAEEDAIRTTLDTALKAAGKQDCHAVANTIFPEAYWNPSKPRSLLFERFTRSLPRIKDSSTKNKRGTYFERMIAGGPKLHPNQLDFVLDVYAKRPSVRRSALQVGVFNPQLDQTGAAQQGFPCLQHVTFAPVKDQLNVNAFYATQYAFERAYGNYLGLCRLGRFVAHELKLELARVTCYTGILLRDGLKPQGLQRLVKAIDANVGAKGSDE